MAGRTRGVWLIASALACGPAPAMHAVRDAPVAAAADDGAGQVPPDTAAAERACTVEHDARACTLAADRYWNPDHGHAFDAARSFRYASEGCGVGEQLACALLADHHDKGLGVAWSVERARALDEAACTAGIGIACEALWNMYIHARGVDRDIDKAYAYRRTARAVSQAACLGNEPRWCVHAASLGPAKNEPSPGALVRHACERGVAAGCVAELVERVAREPGNAAAVRELEGWCGRGESAACAALANVHGASSDPQARARHLALLARGCALGDRDACVRAGVHGEVLRGVPRDDAEARRYFTRACDRGAPRGCLYLAQALVAATAPSRASVAAAQRGCEMGSGEACDLTVQLYAALGDAGGELRWATETCRGGHAAGCRRVVEHGAELPMTLVDAEEVYRDVCRAGRAAACDQLRSAVQAKDAVVRALVDAVANRDAAALAKLLAAHVESDGLEFVDPVCTEQFRKIAVTPDQHGELLRCLAAAGAHVLPPPDPERPSSLAFDADGTIRVVVRGGVVQAIHSLPSSLRARFGSASRAPVPVGPAPGTMLITPESDRVTGDLVILPDDRMRAELVAAGRTQVDTTFFVCRGPLGTVGDIDMTESTGSVAYDRFLERTMSGWTYKPFHLAATAVCGQLRVRYVLPPPQSGPNEARRGTP